MIFVGKNRQQIIGIKADFCSGMNGIVCKHDISPLQITFAILSQYRDLIKEMCRQANTNAGWTFLYWCLLVWTKVSPMFDANMGL